MRSKSGLNGCDKQCNKGQFATSMGHLLDFL